MDRPIRILSLIESLGLGGAEQRLVTDLQHLSRDPHFLAFACILYDDTTLAPKLEGAGVRVLRLGMKNIYDAPKGLSRLRGVLRETKPDILHTQLFGADLYGRFVGRLSGCRVVGTFQSSVHEPTNRYLFSRKRRFLDRLTSRLSDRFIAVSDYVKHSVVRQLHLDPARVEVIHNYVDLEKIQETPLRPSHILRSELGLPADARVLVTVGRLDLPKGHTYLLSAFKELHHEFQDLRLLLIGTGPEERPLRQLCERSRLNGNVLFLGRRSDVFELLRLADLFILPTLSEGFPLTLLEAMAFRKPCIASRLGPILEVIEEGVTGFLTEPANVRQIAESLRFCLKNPDKAREIGEKAYDNVKQKFDAPAATERLKCFYKRVMGKGNLQNGAQGKKAV